MAANVSDSLSLLSSEGEAVRLPDGILSWSRRKRTWLEGDTIDIILL